MAIQPGHPLVPLRGQRGPLLDAKAGRWQRKGTPPPLTSLFFPHRFQMPHFEQSQAYLSYNSTAEGLFGPDAFQTSVWILKHPVHRCIHELTLSYWHRHTGKVERELKRLDVLKIKVEKDWEGARSLLLIFFPP